MCIETRGFTSSQMLGEQALDCILCALILSVCSHRNHCISLRQCTLHVHTELLSFARSNG